MSILCDFSKRATAAIVIVACAGATRAKPTILSIAAIIFPALVAGCGSPPATPEAALESIVAQAKGGKWEQVYDSMLPELQHGQFIYLSVVHGVEHEGGSFKVEAADLYNEQRRRTSFVTMAAKTKSYQAGFATIVVKRATTSGDEATLAITRQLDGEASDDSVVMRKVDGSWKLARLKEKSDGDTAGSLNQLLPPTP